MKRISSLLLFICLIMSSCQSDNKFSHIKLGLTNTTIALKPLPNPKHINQVSHNTTLYIWEDYSLQAENNIITHILRNPNKSEEWVQNWLQRYPYSRVVKESEENLNANYKSLIIKQINTKIIYDKNNGKVFRVVHYEI